MHFNQAKPDNQTPYLVSLSIGLQQAAYAAVLRLLEAVCAEHADLYPIAVNAGIDQHYFDDDFEILWLSIEMGQFMGRDQLRNFMKRALKQHHRWDDGEIVGNFGAGRWSDATLQHLFNAEFPSETIVRHFAGKVIELVGLSRSLIQCLEHADRICWRIPSYDGIGESAQKRCSAPPRHAPIVFTVGAA